MRRRVVALLATAGVLAGVIAGVALLSGDDEDKAAASPVADAVSGQLKYLDTSSSAVVAVDLRYREENWGHVRTVASRLLRELRAAQGGDLEGIPPNLTGALNSLTGFAGLSFEDDVEPVLDGYLAIGITLPPRSPLPKELARLGELLERGASSYSPQHGGYVRPSTPSELRGLRGSRRTRAQLRLVREPDGTPVTRAEGERALRAVRKHEQAAEPRAVVTYRSPRSGFDKIVRKVFEGDAPKKLDGYDDVRLLDDASALVGDDTIVLTIGGETQTDSPRAASAELRRALDRAEAGRGFPPRRLARAQRRSGSDDPFVLATGDLTLARVLAEEPNLERARREVPYLSAVRDVAAAVDLESDRATGTLRVGTDPGRLRTGDLPLAAAGKVELPVSRLVAGASRDQSVTTSFLARVARKLFADSRFVTAVNRAERDLGIHFEDEVLRQFNCPSISVFDTRAQLFGARSCLRDPERMRKLLPRLVPHLPRILTALQSLGDEGLLALLLVAPDAPVTPTLPLAAIEVRPPGKGAAAKRESIYEITGLRDNLASRLSQSGPERVVFGMIGDDFVVASNRGMARRAARLPTRASGVRAASSTRVPGSQLVGAAPGDDEAAAVARILEELIVNVSADRSALTARAELAFGD